MELLFLLINKLGVYTPILLLILYLIYYFISNSFIFIFFISIGFFIGLYMSNIIRQKIPFFSILF